MIVSISGSSEQFQRLTSDLPECPDTAMWTRPYRDFGTGNRKVRCTMERPKLVMFNQLNCSRTLSINYISSKYHTLNIS